MHAVHEPVPVNPYLLSHIVHVVESVGHYAQYTLTHGTHIPVLDNPYPT